MQNSQNDKSVSSINELLNDFSPEKLDSQDRLKAFNNEIDSVLKYLTAKEPVRLTHEEKEAN